MNCAPITDEEIREARREYDRQWRQKNPDKVRAKNRRFYEKKARERRAANNQEVPGHE